MEIGGILSESSMVWVIAKWAYVLAFAVYLVFSLMVWKQIVLMAKSLNGSMAVPLKTIAMVLVGVAMVGLGLAVVML